MNGFSDDQLIEIRNSKSADEKLNSLVQLAADITLNKGKASAENVDLFFAAG